MNTEKLIKRCKAAEESEGRITTLRGRLDDEKIIPSLESLHRLVRNLEHSQTPISDEGRAAIKETFLIHLRSLEDGLVDALDHEYSADQHKLAAINLMLGEK